MHIHLYIKQHAKTKKKYFGKTINNPFNYDGSGRLWQDHIKEHGKDIKTIEVHTFHNQNEATEFALEFSRKK